MDVINEDTNNVAAFVALNEDTIPTQDVGPDPSMVEASLDPSLDVDPTPSLDAGLEPSLEASHTAPRQDDAPTASFEPKVDLTLSITVANQDDAASTLSLDASATTPGFESQVAPTLGNPILTQDGRIAPSLDPRIIPNFDFALGDSTVSLAVVLVGFTCLVYFLNKFLRATVFHPLRKLERPPLPRSPDSLILGHLRQMQEDDPGVIQMRWTKQYGGIVAYRGLFGTTRLLLSDPVALAYVLNNAYQFPKPAGTRSALETILGQGVLTTEGAQHRYQRKLVNPTFTQKSVQAYTPLFHRHARALITRLEEVYRDQDFHELAPGMKPLQGTLLANGITSVVDVLHWLSRTTLDVIGESAFGYQFESLKSQDGSGSAIASAFQHMMTRLGQLTLTQRFMLHGEQWSMFDGHRPLPTSFNKASLETRATVEDVARKMIDDQKQAVVVEESTLLAKLLALNEDPDVPPSQRMSKHEVVGQLTTIILAGHETTSTALTWALWALAHHPEIQTALRDEIKEAWPEEESEDFSYEDLHSLKLLDRVTNEVLRLHPSVHSTNREPIKDDVIPLSKPVRQKDGTMVNRIHVEKGQPLILSIVTYNRSEAIWGPDADQFKPDRWLNLPKTVTQNGLSSSGITHLGFISGPRNCVGSRFAITEFKVILSHVLKKFVFEPLPEETVAISRKQVVVTRPRVVGLEDQGTQMPLKFRLVDEEVQSD